jgi:hypothetical protein
MKSPPSRSRPGELKPPSSYPPVLTEADVSRHSLAMAMRRCGARAHV